ncbi:hypothetical protein GSI_15122 [Ganoderma sinense ZZ0214-1]|uniref:DUF6532 domain-containing protein n=1 Tax=Ganoderma sinense ZZ0214-1 TaxID=1077348 RepID=A0A2G8RLN7_9APHY|nr:hypothetical protein GSI_15122 [Ganoderma sinense ZZ0214-1]
MDRKVWTNDLSGARKRALSLGEDKALAAKPKKTKHASSQVKSSVKAGAQDSAVNLPPRFERKKNVLLATDLDNSGDEDVPLSVAVGARSTLKTPVTASSEKTTLVQDVQDPQDDGHSSENDGSDDNLDPEAHVQALAEMSESDDEVLVSMEAHGETQALGDHLAAEPEWSDSKPQPDLKGKGVASRVSSESGDDLPEDASDYEHAEPEAQRKDKQKSNQDQAGQASAPASGLSKTELRALQERPVFKTPIHTTSTSSLPTSSSSKSTFIPLPPQAAAAPLPPQPATVTTPDDDGFFSDSDSDMVDADEPIDPMAYRLDAVQAAIVRLERKIVVEDAFPDAHKRGRGVRLTLVEATRSLMPAQKYQGLVARLISDPMFTRGLASIPNQRISTFRRKLKEKSDSSVPSSFDLVAGKAQGIVEWILPHLRYVYPIDIQKHQISNSQPYHAPIIIIVLRESFFRGPRSFYLRNEDIFRSSLPGREEREIPMVMLALVGAAIHASLVDWKSGECIETNFSAEKYMDAYSEHMTFLEAIKSSGPVKYHTMMYKLFDEASGGARTIHGNPVGDPPIAHLNLEAMAED